MSPLLEGVALSKSYRQGGEPLEVLRGVSLALQPGEMVVIVGPSGAGKSTLLHLLGGLDTPTAGKVIFQGRNLYALSDRERAQLRNRAFGFVFQFYHLVPELTALENVMLPGWMGNGGGPSAKTAQRARGLLEEVGLGRRLSHHPGQLSGGEQQRVAIARALMNGPELLFCDEPTGNLDSETGSKIVELLVRLNRQERRTLVVVTHETSMTQVAGRVLSLKDGRLWG
ncbi:MAG: ABC transporter ATP-binding protein [Candidatus Omnitrophica bacterium]|nr:ABC transporter ATP-binding protein [Candidatus Omnitrophota bacterium]